MIMASISSAVKYHKYYRTNIAVTLILIILSLSLFFCSNSAESVSPRNDDDEDGEGLKRMKMVLGSKPPRCVNKCMSCRPCMAALIISQGQKNGVNGSPQGHDQSYYLLAWKCKCRDKFFQP